MTISKVITRADGTRIGSARQTVSPGMNTKGKAKGLETRQPKNEIRAKAYWCG